MALGQHKRAVGSFSNYRDTELALMELQSSGFPMNKVSVVGENLDRSEIAGATAGKSTDEKVGGGVKAGATAGVVTGGLIGLLGSIGALAIPGVGPVMAGGAIATLLADTVVGGAIGAAAGGLVGGLVGLGVPEAKAQVYNDRLSRGEYLVFVEGTDAELATAEGIMSVRGIQDWGIYDVPTDTGRRSMGRHKRAVGVFSTRRETEHALGELRTGGFDMDRVSVIAKDGDSKGDIAGIDVHDSADNKADEGATKGALTGGTLGGLTGLLVGLGLVAIPGIGPIMLAGASATAIATTLAGTALGAAAGSLIGALVGLGIPEEEARAYNDRVARGDYLVLVDGSEAEVAKAGAVLSRGGIQDWNTYDSPSVDTARADYGTPGTPGADTTPGIYDPNQGVAGKRRV
ncbi:MAG: histidine kinase [Microcoleus sp. PH2017_40_RAT_O_B]|uniref:general stress protein n=1 Tax=unclassified Microcoleus TaxID=2642155 RepID=UPI001D3EBF8E|nr:MULTISPECIES: general stress protein [unclassified Microcoleus]TAG06371.1 MAG: histidine kinase [Oscillatoriales cyanobacterium]MCC3434368.1 histidine kinase [Microcoleus sp. PH2017_05_CCC_O_A]MCC3471497.1 histidine kinase [Microcoleus sp. PH2017_13_LAR_U_A]MCC3484209.1 histidine kinase [Microcoleus sp. PH2017_14_LAR_D_A]MCC3514813.1 histidine kinase [Microcoleus sp. PH2017_18_LLB_O_A]